MENWEEAERIRAFYRAMSECFAQLELPDERRKEIQLVLDWTDEYAESLDLLADLSDSLDEFIHPEKKYSWLR